MMTMRSIFAATLASFAFASDLPVRADPSPSTMARNETNYRESCQHDTMKDCSTLPDLAGLPVGRASVQAARDSCDRLNTSMLTFCTVAAFNPPQSREVMTAVADVIAAKKALMKAVAAAKKPDR